MSQLWSLAWRNSASKPQRTALTIIAVAVGVGLIFGTLLTAEAERHHLTQAARQLLGKADLEVVSISDTGFGAPMVAAVTAGPQVATASPIVVKRVSALLKGDVTAVQLVGFDPALEARLNGVQVTAGAMLDENDQAGVLLDSSWAAEHGFHLGDAITLFSIKGPTPIAVKGLVGTSRFAQTGFGAVAFITLAAAQGDFRLGAHVTQVSVALKASKCLPDCYPAEFDAFRKDLATVATQDYIVRDDHAFTAGTQDPFADLQPLLIYFSVLTLIIGLFLVYNSLAVATVERRREIGLLRAAGATEDWVRSLFLLQAGMMGVAGSLIGVAVGALTATVLVAYLRNASGQSDLAVNLDPVALGAAVVLGVLVALVAGLGPARRAASLTPMEGLRPVALYATARTSRRLSLFSIMLLIVSGGVLVLTALGKVPSQAAVGPAYLISGSAMLIFVGACVGVIPAILRPMTWIISLPFRIAFPSEALLARNGIIRRPNRSALTIAGLVVSAAMIVSVATLADGARAAGEQWVSSLFVSDILAVSPVQQSDDVRAAIDTIPGVSATSPIAFFNVRAGDHELAMSSVVPLDYATARRLDFVSGDGTLAFSQLQNTRSIFISNRLASTRHLAVGDTVQLGGDLGTFPYLVAAIVGHTLPSPGGEETAMIGSELARRDFNVTGFNILQVIPNANPPTDLHDTLSANSTRYGMQLESVADIRSGVDHSVNALLVLLVAIGLLSAFLGVISLLNTILINVTESRREFGLLRVIGLTQQQMRRLIGVESMLLGLAGALIGSLLGLLLAGVMLQLSSSPGFEPPFNVPWLPISAVVVATVVASRLAVALPARKAANESVVAAISTVD